jgi:hypothetical protein
VEVAWSSIAKFPCYPAENIKIVHVKKGNALVNSFLSSSALYWLTIVTINKRNPGVGLDEIGLLPCGQSFLLNDGPLPASLAYCLL